MNFHLYMTCQAYLFPKLHFAMFWRPIIHLENEFSFIYDMPGLIVSQAPLCHEWIFIYIWHARLTSFPSSTLPCFGEANNPSGEWIFIYIWHARLTCFPAPLCHVPIINEFSFAMFWRPIIHLENEFSFIYDMPGLLHFAMFWRPISQAPLCHVLEANNPSGEWIFIYIWHARLTCFPSFAMFWRPIWIFIYIWHARLTSFPSSTLPCFGGQ